MFVREKSMDSIYQIYKDVFIDKPIESFEISKDLVLYAFSSIYLLPILAVIGAVYALYKYFHSKTMYFTIFSVVWFAISLFFIKESYLDEIVERKFLPKLTTEQVKILEGKYLEAVKKGFFENLPTKKQKLGLEEPSFELSYCDLELLIMQHKGQSIAASCR